jgi:hypothetical protein
MDLHKGMKNNRNEKYAENRKDFSPTPYFKKKIP